MWRPIGRRWDPQYAGPRPWSEPETRLIRALILRVRPTVTIWFHQPQDLVRAWGPSIPAGRRYARLAGERFRALRWPNGGPNWQNHRFPGAASFVVELPSGALSRAAVLRPRLPRSAARPFRLHPHARGRRPDPPGDRLDGPARVHAAAPAAGGRAALVVFYLFDWSAT